MEQMEMTNQVQNSSQNQNSQLPTDNQNTTTFPQAPIQDAASSDYLVTQKIDPSTLSKDQVESDLEMFKSAEEKMFSKTPNYIKATRENRSNSLPPRPLTEVDILRIKNPFRGE